MSIDAYKPLQFLEQSGSSRLNPLKLRLHKTVTGAERDKDRGRTLNVDGIAAAAKSVHILSRQYKEGAKGNGICVKGQFQLKTRNSVEQVRKCW
jgi:hypothetical protein